MTVTPSQFDVIAKLLDASAVRHRVIGQNVANVNTPGYERQEVNFEDQLTKLLEAEKPADVSAMEFEVRRTPNLPERADGNNVDIDREMGEMTKNTTLFETYSQILATRLGMMRSAISGRS
jgi:flagellar basal-body rod protein FlgB